jgi:hypothetical protein
MLLPKFILLTNFDNTDTHVNVSAIVCIMKGGQGKGSRLTMLNNCYIDVKETPVEIQSKF